MTQDIKGLTPERRERLTKDFEAILGPVPMRCTQAETDDWYAMLSGWLAAHTDSKMADLLESLLSRQPVEVEGVKLQLVPVEPSDGMLTALNGYACCAGYIPEGYAALLIASANEGKKNV